MPTGNDLQVLASAFEACQRTLRAEGTNIAGLRSGLAGAPSDLSNPDVAGDNGDARAKLTHATNQVLSAFDGIGDHACPSLAQAIQNILDHFHELDAHQAANVPAQAAVSPASVATAAAPSGRPGG